MNLAKAHTANHRFVRFYDGESPIPEGWALTEMLTRGYPTKQHADRLELVSTTQKVLIRVAPAANESEGVKHG